MKWNDPKVLLPSSFFLFSYHHKENHFLNDNKNVLKYFSYNFIKFTISTVIYYFITALHISIFSIYIWNYICMYVIVFYCIFPQLIIIFQIWKACILYSVTNIWIWNEAKPICDDKKNKDKHWKYFHSLCVLLWKLQKTLF